MGYRSDVVFAFYPSAKGDGQAVSSWLMQHWPQAWCEVDAGEEMVLVRYSDVKWYADYEFVRAAAAAVDAFAQAFEADEDRTARAHWEMARIGEDEADIERDGSPFMDYRLSIRRDIEVM
jgi:uncharacterized iron-regulated protein